MCHFEQELAELSSAEEFLEYFGVDYDPAIVRVKRLHILQRFHDYLVRAEPLPTEIIDRRAVYATWLRAAYQDFLNTDGRKEQVFRLFQTPAVHSIQVPLSTLWKSPYDS